MNHKGLFKGPAFPNHHGLVSKKGQPGCHMSTKKSPHKEAVGGGKNAAKPAATGCLAEKEASWTTRAEGKCELQRLTGLGEVFQKAQCDFFFCIVLLDTANLAKYEYTHAT